VRRKLSSIVSSRFFKKCDCSACHSVSRITDERGNGRVDQIWQAWARGDPLEVINFWWWSGFACGFRITFIYFTIAEYEIFGHLLAFLVQSMVDLYHIYLAKWLTLTMRPQNLGTDPTDIRIRIRINPKIRIGISDHFRLKSWRWRRFALSKTKCCCFDFNGLRQRAPASIRPRAPADLWRHCTSTNHWS